MNSLKKIVKESLFLFSVFISIYYCMPFPNAMCLFFKSSSSTIHECMIKTTKKNIIKNTHVIVVCIEKVIYYAIYAPLCCIGVLSVHLSHSLIPIFPLHSLNSFISAVVLFEHTFN